MNSKQVEQMFAAMDESALARTKRQVDSALANLGGYDMSKEWEETDGYTPAPVVVAPPPYDLDASDSEWHDKPIASPEMGIDVLKSGRSLITQCGPLQITAELASDDDVYVTIWNTETCVDVGLPLGIFKADYYLSAFGSLADGAWKVYCPDEPDGAPQY